MKLEVRLEFCKDGYYLLYVNPNPLTSKRILYNYQLRLNGEKKNKREEKREEAEPRIFPISYTALGVWESYHYSTYIAPSPPQNAELLFGALLFGFRAQDSSDSTCGFELTPPLKISTRGVKDIRCTTLKLRCFPPPSLS